MTFIIADSYRRQYINRIYDNNKEPLLFIKYGYRANIALPFFLVYYICRLIFRRKSLKLVINDDPGLAYIIVAYFFLKEKNNQVVWFFWNYFEEISQFCHNATGIKKFFIEKIIKYKNFKFAGPYEFDEFEINHYNQLFNVKVKPLVKPLLLDHQQNIDSGQIVNRILFIGEIDIAKPDNIKKQTNDYIWTSAKNALNGLSNIDIQTSLYQKYGLPVLILYRNRVRYLFLKFIEEKFGSKCLFIGDSFKANNFRYATPSNFDLEQRVKWISTSKVCIDLLGKSSMDMYYPRSSEIINYGYGLLQLEGSKSKCFYSNNQYQLRVFKSKYDCEAKISNLLSMNLTEYEFEGKALKKETSALLSQLTPVPSNKT